MTLILRTIQTRCFRWYSVGGNSWLVWGRMEGWECGIRRKLSGFKSFLDIKDTNMSVCSSFFSAYSTCTNGCLLRILLFGKEPTNFTPVPLIVRSKYTTLPRPLWVTWKHSLGTELMHWGSTRFVAAVTKLQDTGRLLTKHN